MPKWVNEEKTPRFRRFRISVLKVAFAGCIIALVLLSLSAPTSKYSAPDYDFRFRNGLHAHKDHQFHRRLRSLRDHAKSLVKKNSIRDELKYYMTSDAHLAGQNYDLVNHTAEKFEEFGFTPEITRYDVLLNYPVDHKVDLLNNKGKVYHSLKLTEPPLSQDPTTDRKDSVPTFHGYSANGTAEGELVYANFCTREDFQALQEAGVDIRGKVTLCRYGGLFRGLKVKFSEEWGAVAALIYSDPAEDGAILEPEYEPYPFGPARNPDSVQRGSVQDLPYAPGDPTTPGYASHPDVDRTDPQGLPSIPSIPISYNDAIPLFEAIGTNGVVFDDWKGKIPDVKYYSGPSQNKVLVESIQDYAIRPIYNVIGKLKGESEKEVIIGNHRDAWIVGGADPNSGSAVLIEVGRVLGRLAANGWVPKHTIVLASWDAEEYGLVGSTEFGEDRAEELQANTLAYLNCDVAVSGSHLSVSGHPLLSSVINRAVNDVPFGKDGSLSDYWGGDKDTRISPLGSGSDYTVFQDHLGIPSLDIGFGRGRNDPVYHYHSNYDSYRWTMKFADPKLERHTAIARTLLLAALELSESELIPFEVPKFAKTLEKYIKDIGDSYSGPVSEALTDLSSDANAFRQRARAFEHYSKKKVRALRKTAKKSGWWNKLKYAALKVQLAHINAKLFSIDRKFLHPEGLETRPWFKHIVYAPGRYTGYAGQVLPGLAESIEDNDDKLLEKWVEIISNILKDATNSL